MTTFLTEAETAALVDDNLAFDAAREAFLAAATGSTFPVAIGSSSTPDTRFTLKSGSAGELVGVKIGSFWPGNVEVPRHSSTIVLLDPPPDG
ncbi:hypothetical protein [Lentzea sp. NBRC 102530]|uniref:hypothetical protein n=1 Tax=Lentzea sp. NBRC 102530 TaxID=3032201 RepID=UPI0024A4715A|nr:hypothetical protein [Lentzea sp. NBRC 102530]GLY54483.1 hypothetical protein Lesp01_81390 [Lentzea sp. NBRC 102530]